jgi:hypothetical protein
MIKEGRIMLKLVIDSYLAVDVTRLNPYQSWVIFGVENKNVAVQNGDVCKDLPRTVLLGHKNISIPDNFDFSKPAPVTYEWKEYEVMDYNKMNPTYIYTVLEEVYDE